MSTFHIVMEDLVNLHKPLFKYVRSPQKKAANEPLVQTADSHLLL